ncbi:MAG: HAMP domain-containing histidine kinase [Acidimicrobiia bacterium]|nr:HAMP domain-containing histidine kinase [Acidimicrobiia bacterium]
MADLSLPTSIRARITAIAALVVGVVLAVTSVVLVIDQQRQLTTAVDSTLIQRADDLESLLQRPRDLVRALGASGDPDLLAQLVGPDGAVLSANPVIEGAPPLATGQYPAQTIRTVRNLPVDDDVFRLLSRPLSEGQVLHVASNLDDVRDTTRVLIGSLVVTVPIAVFLLAAVIWWLVGRTLKPVDAIRAEVLAISAEHLDRRVPEPESDDEIHRLAVTMNEMLDRIDVAVDAQRRFVADASHELRSPLTRLRTEIETAAGRPDLDVVLGSVYQDVVGLQALVEDLLHLARSDAGEALAGTDRVDLEDVVLEEVEKLSNGAVRVDATDVENVAVVGSRTQLARAVRNLVENAVHHASSHVTVTMTGEPGVAVLAVTDDGPGVPLDGVDAVFERFRRLDAARSTADGGTGLGLAIVRDIAERHGGSVSVDPSHEPGARFVLRLPVG